MISIYPRPIFIYRNSEGGGQKRKRGGALCRAESCRRDTKMIKR